MSRFRHLSFLVYLTIVCGLLMLPTRGAAQSRQTHEDKKSQPAQLYASSNIGFGAIFLDASVGLHYGTPADQTGLVVRAQVRSSAFRLFLGLEHVSEHIFFRLGARGAIALDRGLVDQKANYQVADWALVGDNRSRHITTEATLAVRERLSESWHVLAKVGLYYADPLADNVAFREENLRVMTHGPWIWRARATVGYGFEAFGHRGNVDLHFEAIHEITRDEMTLRPGIDIELELDETWSTYARFMLPVMSPDFLGMFGGIFRVGFVWHWNSFPTPVHVPEEHVPEVVL